MKILITGICGFVGSSVAHALLDARSDCEISGVDNFIRPGSEGNRDALRARGVKLHHGDVRQASDLETLPAVDWVIDAAANPSVLAGVDGKSSSRQVVEHNLFGTVNLLEHCRRHGAGFILLSTSRVYAIAPLAALPVEPHRRAGVPAPGGSRFAAGSLRARVGRNVQHRRADLALRRDQAGQRGDGARIRRNLRLSRVDQPLRRAGGGRAIRAARPGDRGVLDQRVSASQAAQVHRLRRLGHQVRDALHPRDLVGLLLQQMAERAAAPSRPRTVNLGGGEANAFSLADLSAWCADRFGEHPVASDPAGRAFDIPWLLMDAALAREAWGWQPTLSLADILLETALHAEAHPQWLERSAAF